MINIFMGVEGVVDGEGGSSKRCLKWGSGGGNLSTNILKQGVGKGESCSQRRVSKVSPALKILIVHSPL